MNKITGKELPLRKGRNEKKRRERETKREERKRAANNKSICF